MQNDRTTTLQARLEALTADNERLRTALAEAEARAAGGGHAFLLRDATALLEEPLVCSRPGVTSRVTVVIPAYNAWHHLERAVTSVWRQTIDPARIELIVVDDGSSDGTWALAGRLCAQSPVAMRVLRHPGGRNRGVAPTRHLAVSEASGEFIALLDADDRFLPERLAWTTDLLTAQPSLAAVCSLGRNVDDNGVPVVGHNGTERAGEWRTLGEGLTPPFTFDQLWKVDPIANSSLTIRRAAIEQVGGFPTLMGHQAEDWLLVLKLSLLAPIPCIDQELIDYTHHPGAYTNNYHAQGLREGTRIEVFYHLTWWMMRSAAHAEHGTRFFRREYPRLIAEHQRFLPLLRECYQAGARPAAGVDALGEQLQRLNAELESLRNVVQVKLHENKRLRHLVAAGKRAAPIATLFAEQTR